MLIVGAVLSTVNVAEGPAAGALLPAKSVAVPRSNRNSQRTVTRDSGEGHHPQGTRTAHGPQIALARAGFVYHDVPWSRAGLIRSSHRRR